MIPGKAGATAGGDVSRSLKKMGEFDISDREGEEMRPFESTSAAVGAICAEAGNPQVTTVATKDKGRELPIKQLLDIYEHAVTSGFAKESAVKLLTHVLSAISNDDLKTTIFTHISEIKRIRHESTILNDIQNKDIARHIEGLLNCFKDILNSSAQTTETAVMKLDQTLVEMQPTEEAGTEANQLQRSSSQRGSEDDIKTLIRDYEIAAYNTQSGCSASMSLLRALFTTAKNDGTFFRSKIPNSLMTLYKEFRLETSNMENSFIEQYYSASSKSNDNDSAEPRFIIHRKRFPQPASIISFVTS